MFKRISLLFSIFVVIVTLITLLPSMRGAAGAVALDPVAVRAAAAATGLGSLRNVGIPQVNNINDFYNAGLGPKSLAVMLGKALFWDMQVGSDGQACASCHFHAGADNRVKNQLNPGQKAGDNTYGNAFVSTVPGFPQFGPNYSITANDYSFHQLAEPQREDFNHRVILKDTNDVMSSQGPFLANYAGFTPGQLKDNGVAVADPVFKVGNVNVRRVEPRNTPTTINAVFNFENFWDGRARNQFNGVNPFGPLDPAATVLINSGTLQEVTITLPNSSLASQAVGPPLSDLEMSFFGRTFPDVGKKMVGTRPLAFQTVSLTDSILSGYSRADQAAPNDKGLTSDNYSMLIQAVFQPKYWNSTNVITFAPNGSRVINPPGTPGGYTQMEANFSLFFGLAVQAYESTLVSDRTRFDLFMEGEDNIMTQDELAGLLTFINIGSPAQAANPIFTGISQGACVGCHKGPLLSDATIPGMGIEGRIEVDLAPIIVDGKIQVGTELVMVDNGFYNIGVRPTSEDIGRGASINGKPLSAAQQSKLGLPFAPPLPPGVPPSTRVVADGAFKVPSLRNAELTGPYFHNGCARSLRQLLDFYHRHSDFGETNIVDFDSPMANVKLDARVDASGRDLDADQLVKFLVSLTDDRVRDEAGPFDHPQISIPNGHPGDATGITSFVNVNGVNQAADDLIEIPAIGRDGRNAAGYAYLLPFLGTGALLGSNIHLNVGWNTLSTPIRLYSTMDTWGEFTAHYSLNYQTAYTWNGTAFEPIAAGHVMTPLEGIFVKMTAPAVIDILPYEGISAPPSKTLRAGWNFVGSAFLDAQMPVKDALSSIFFVPNSMAPAGLPLWGYTQVLSPTINAFDWVYIRDSLVIPNMLLGEGYWIWMVNPGDVNGFTSTPAPIQ
jgi:cytochrome c peroxidase